MEDWRGRGDLPVSERPDIEALRGTLEWAVAIVGSRLAKGRPMIQPTDAEVAEAARTLIGSFRAAGHNHVVTDDGVWSLVWLEEEEIVEVARVIIGAWLEDQNLELWWIGHGNI